MDTLTALDALAAEGMTHFKSEYRTSERYYEAVGLAVAAHESNANNLMRISYAALEDWNHHSACAVLDWIFPALHPSTDPTFDEYLVSAQAMQYIIGDRIVKMRTTWNDETHEYNVRKYRVRLLVEEVE